MPSATKKQGDHALRPRLRIIADGEIALGPGKAELLSQLEATGSIAEAARRMGMSYMRAWTLLKTMEGCFNSPLVTVARGGKSGGGAALTPAGKQVLSLYQEMESEAIAATDKSWNQLKRLMR